MVNIFSLTDDYGGGVDRST